MINCRRLVDTTLLKEDERRHVLLRRGDIEETCLPTRELNASVTQEWQNGDTELLPQDKALIQGTSLPQLLQTSQDHKLAWLAQIRLARLAYPSTEDGDESTDIDSDTSETPQDP
jgi:hypothetical protein